MREQVDPQLPYIQVHRSVGAKAAGVASALGVTYQHARGSLEVFWEGLADRRLLAGKEAIVLSPKAVATRLKLAFGMEVDPDLMVEAGFLEPQPEGFRVRGMSPYLNAERGRLAKKNGGVQPVTPVYHDRGNTAVAPRSDPGATPQATPVAPRSDPGATPVPPGRVERRETIVSSSIKEEELSAPPVPLPPKPDSPLSSGSACFAYVQHERHAHGYVTEKPPSGLALGKWFNEFLLELNGNEELAMATLKGFFRSEYWRARNFPFTALMSEWRKFVPRRAL